MAASVDSRDVSSLEPALVWRLFAGIAATPRPSKREGRIREHVCRTVAEHGLSAREEGAGNLVIDVPASPGCESAPVTVLQAHLDMVCEKNRGTEHDFDNDPIRLLVDVDAAGGERIVRADGTTLGADNGIGVAMALAAAFSADVRHGPLELLLTIDEEAGMTGAKSLTPKSFWGRRLLNLDSEEDDALYIGCAGGCDTNLSWGFDAEPIDPNIDALRIAVEGLRGGHSGGDIHENRGNAIKLLAATLLRSGIDGLRIGSLSGGSKRNAIPREAHADVFAAAPGAVDALRKAASAVCAEAQDASSEPDISIDVRPVDRSARGEQGERSVLSAVDSRRVLSALAALPSGVLGMSPTVPGLVQTSNNVSTVVWSRGEDGRRVGVEIGTLSRSSSSPWMESTLEQIAAVGRLAGASVSTGNGYPGWEPNPDSPVLATCRRVYEATFDEPPKVAAIHAGLECGIIGERVGEVDMVSFGPRIEGAHSPDERVYVASVAKSWKYLTAVLGELANG